MRKKINLDLTNRTTIVTGGATGLGEESVLPLAKEGVSVCFTYIREEECLERSIETVKVSTNVKIIAVKTDLSDEQNWEDLFVTCTDRLGKADILVGNVGTRLNGHVTETNPQDWDLVMDVSLKVIFHLSQLFINHCLQHDQMDSVLNITSQAVLHGSTAGHAYYAASKISLVALAISLTREVAKQKISVNNIVVGIIDTVMTRKNIEQNPDYYAGCILVDRVAQPRETVDISVLMVSPKASYTTGATLDVTDDMLMC